MLFHASIPARDAAHTATIIAELWGAQALPFPPFPGCYLVFAGDRADGDGRGTAIEVYPAGHVLHGGPEMVVAEQVEAAPATETHIAIGTHLEEDAVHAIAAREGWRSLTCWRGPAFQVVEVWVDNRFMIEVLTPKMQADYKAFMTPANWAAAFGVAPLAA